MRQVKRAKARRAATSETEVLDLDGETTRPLRVTPPRVSPLFRENPAAAEVFERGESIRRERALAREAVDGLVRRARVDPSALAEALESAAASLRRGGR